MKHKFLIFVFAFLMLNVMAQPPRKFYCRYGGDGADIGYSVKQIYDGSYILLGSTTSFNVGGTDAYLLLVDTMGNGVWQKTFGGSGNEVGKSVIINPLDSGYIFTGFASSYGNGGYDVYVVRTDKKGNLIWQQNFGTNEWDFGNDVCIDKDTNIVVCGNTQNKNGYGKTDALIFKLKMKTGAVLWSKFYGGAQDDDFVKLKLTSDKILTVVGNTKSYRDINGDFWFLKMNTTGDTLYTKFLGIPNKQEKCYDFIEDKNNEIIIGGSFDTSATNKGQYVSYVMVAASNGDFLRDNKIKDGHGDSNDKVGAISNAKNGSKFFAVRSKLNGSLGLDIQPILYDSFFWTYDATTYGDIYTDEANSIEFTKDDGFVIVGVTNGYGLYSSDICLIKAMDTSMAVSGTLIISGLSSENESKKTNIYYHNYKIFLENNPDFLQYEICDLNSKVIQYGIAKNEIPINSSVEPGVYYLISKKERRNLLKFIIE